MKADELRRLAAEYEGILSRLMRLASEVQDAAARTRIERMIDEERERFLSNVEDAAAAWAAARESLMGAERSANVGSVTATQLQRRGAAIAAGHAKSSGSPFGKAVNATKWRSQARYARQRLGVKPSTLSGYINGTYKCPARIAAMVEKDLGLPANTKTWPLGLTD